MRLRKALATTLLASATVVLSRPAAALGPLEYPDNGATAFSRGGAWLATATDPIAAHYNPAALATQKSGFSVDLNAAFHKVCFDRKNPGDALTGPQQQTNTTPGTFVYLPACSERQGFPKTIPAIALNWRVSRTVGIGFAFAPPSAYTDAAGAWPEFQNGWNNRTKQKQAVPAPYRYMQTENISLVFMPTLGVGVEVLPGLRVGAGFIWGIASVDVTKFDTITTTQAEIGDHAANDDVRAHIKTKDFFMPGAILSAHWSATRNLDLSVWGRWLDAIKTTDADLELLATYYGSRGRNPYCSTDPGADCKGKITRNEYGDKDFERFKFFVIPPELRVGIRFHIPRNSSKPKTETGATIGNVMPVRDPLHDDLFDIELNGSYTQSSKARTAEIRFPMNPDGTARVSFRPGGLIPPNADRLNGYDDTFGARLGGQFNVVQDKLGVMAGTWVEQQAADDKYLHISPVPALRGGFGGGIILRQAPLDFVIGYQRHWSKTMDNHGNGGVRANAGTALDGDFAIGKEPADRQFRTNYAINGGRVSQSAHVFTMGAVWRF